MASPMLAGVVDAIEAGIYWPGEASWFAPLMNGLRHDDHYMVAADFDAYFATQPVSYTHLTLPTILLV